MGNKRCDDHGGDADELKFVAWNLDTIQEAVHDGDRQEQGPRGELELIANLHHKGFIQTYTHMVERGESTHSSTADLD